MSCEIEGGEVPRLADPLEGEEERNLSMIARSFG
jgi:hypothetical protein